MEYRIYYGDGSTYGGDVSKAPAAKDRDGVQCIIWNDPDLTNQQIGRVVMHDYDIYICSSDIGWHGTNKYADLMMHLENGKVLRVLSGLWIDREKYKEIERRATKDPTFKPKSATDPVREDGAE